MSLLEKSFNKTIIQLADSESNDRAHDGVLAMEEQKRTEAYHKSRLGQILIKKGYISPQQLDEAVRSSETSSEDTTKLLGEYLIEHRIISRWQLRRALSTQAQLRLTASLAMILLNPVYDFLSGTQSTQPLDSTLEKLITPLFTQLSASNKPAFEYAQDKVSIEVKDNNVLKLRIHSSCGELNFDGLRLRVSESGSHENLTLDDLDLSNARLFIRTIHNKLNTALPES